jgi:integrase
MKEPGLTLHGQDEVVTDFVRETTCESMQLENFKTVVSMNTRKAYQSDLKYIRQWGCISFENFNFPMTENLVLLFITDHLQGMSEVKEKLLMSPLIRNGYKAKPGLHSLATVKRRLFALTLYHKEQGFNDPCVGDKIKQILRVKNKIVKRVAQQKAITRDIFERLLITCDSSVKGIRDKAILLLVWANGGLQRSNIVTAQVENITNTGKNFLLRIPAHNSKTDHTIDVPIRGRAVQALLNWIMVAAIRQGAIFRAVGKNDKVSDNPLSPIDINRIVKQRCKMAGFDAKQFSSRSLHSGYLMERERILELMEN